MSTPVFWDNESVFFVGGRGDKSGRTANAGGCTRQWWLNECPNGTDAEKAAAMAKLMGTNGEPIINMSSASYTAANNRITKTNIAVGVEVGMVAYVVESDIPDENVSTGRYEITDVDPSGDWIECSGINGSGDTDVDVNIGGAFDGLNNVADETSASLHSVTIYTNLSETLGGSVSVWAGGSYLKNTFKRIIGFNTVPGDMSRGGTYYESPLEILQNGSIDSSKCVELDADANSFEVLYITGGADNLVFENLHLKGTTGHAIYFTSVSDNVVFRNCRFSNSGDAISSRCDNLLFDSCYSHDDITNHHHDLQGMNNVMLGCVGKMSTGTNLANFVDNPGAAIGCIAVGGQFGFRMYRAGSGALIMGNTFHNTESKGVLLDACDSAVVINNIFCLAPGAIGIYVRLGGSAVHNDYNCFIESDGTPLTPTGNEYSGGETPVMGAHSVQVDPDFVDAANGDFRVRNPAVLRGGRPDAEGNATQMGAVLQEYRFAERARVMNAGRTGIVR